MEIYIKITSKENLNVKTWWTDTGREMYLVDGDDLIAESEITGDIYYRGTAFGSVQDAKIAAAEAIDSAGWDGIVKPKASYWSFIDGELTEVKLLRNNKIKPVKD